MDTLDKIVENKLRGEGWLKLLPTDEQPTGQPHRFRYADKNFTSINIIQHGALAGVYQGHNWQEKYKQVDWATPECDCKDCSLVAGLESMERNAKAAAAFVQSLEGVDAASVDIASLQIDQADNGYKKVTFYYKAK